MLLGVRFCIVTLMFFFINTAIARDIHILFLKENGSATCHEKSMKSAESIYHIGRNGEILSNNQYFPWAICEGGAEVVAIAQRLMEDVSVDRVIFLPVAAAGTKSHDWLVGGKAFENLNSALQVAKDNNIGFDYALWQGGLVDGSVESGYKSNVWRVMKYITLNAKVDKWIIAPSASCQRKVNDLPIFMRRDVVLNHFAGPDIGSFAGNYRSDPCTLNALGNRKMAEQWFSTMRDADILSSRYQKESLLYYFK